MDSFRAFISALQFASCSPARAFSYCDDRTRFSGNHFYIFLFKHRTDTRYHISPAHSDYKTHFLFKNVNNSLELSWNSLFKMCFCVTLMQVPHHVCISQGHGGGWKVSQSTLHRSNAPCVDLLLISGGFSAEVPTLTPDSHRLSLIWAINWWLTLNVSGSIVNIWLFLWLSLENISKLLRPSVLTDLCVVSLYLTEPLMNCWMSREKMVSQQNLCNWSLENNNFIWT